MVVLNSHGELEKVERQGFGYEPTNWEIDEKEMQEFETNLKKNRRIIEEICDVWSPATNSYALLYLEYLKTKFDEIQINTGKNNIIIKIPKKLAKHLTSPEAVGRAFRSLNQEGKCLPTSKAVLIKRMRHQKVLKKYFSSEE